MLQGTRGAVVEYVYVKDLDSVCCRLNKSWCRRIVTPLSEVMSADLP